VVTGIHRRVRVREVLNLQLALGTSEIMLCCGTTRSTHDSDWKKGLLRGSFTWPLKMYHPKRKERIANQHFSRARKLQQLNYIQFHGYIHMSSAISQMFPSSASGVFLKCLRVFCPQVGRFGILRHLWRKIPLQNISTLWVFWRIFWKSWTLVFTGQYDIFSVSRFPPETSGPVKKRPILK